MNTIRPRRMNARSFSVELLEHRRVLATISGQVVNDLNGDGNIDVDEPGVAGVHVFLDANGNGQLDRNGSFIEPDDYENHERIGLKNPNATLSVVNEDNEVIDFDEVKDVVQAKTDQFPSTGGNVFGYIFEDSDVNFFHTQRRLRIDFESPVSSVAIDIIGDGPFAGTAGLLEAFDADGNSVGTYRSSEVLPNVSETMSVVSASENISWAVAYTAPPRVQGRLDNLRFNFEGSEQWTITGPDGTYRFNDVDAGTHEVGIVDPIGFGQTLPADGTRTETVSANEDLGSIDFAVSSNSISGNVFDDLGVVGTYEPGTDTPIENAVVFIDQNGNGVLDQTAALEPDDYAENTVVDHLIPGVTLSTADFRDIPRQHVRAISDPLSSTGSMVFGNDNGASFTNNSRLRVDFDSDVSVVSIDFIGTAEGATERGAVFAYNAAGEQLEGSVLSENLAQGETQTLTVTSAAADISYIVAFSIQVGDAGFGHFDNLSVGGLVTEPNALTRADGSYSFSSVEAGTVNVHHELAEGKVHSIPDSDFNSVSIGGSESIADVNFGVVDETQLSWHNSINPLDVDNNGIVVPFDVLMIINELNQPVYRDDTGLLPEPPDPVPFFFDVDDNGFVTPFDAVLIINWLNEGPGQGVAAVAASVDHTEIVATRSEVDDSAQTTVSDADNASENAIDLDAVRSAAIFELNDRDDKSKNSIDDDLLNELAEDQISL